MQNDFLTSFCKTNAGPHHTSVFTKNADDAFEEYCKQYFNNRIGVFNLPAVRMSSNQLAANDLKSNDPNKSETIGCKEIGTGPSHTNGTHYTVYAQNEFACFDNIDLREFNGYPVQDPIKQSTKNSETKDKHLSFTSTIGNNHSNKKKTQDSQADNTIAYCKQYGDMYDGHYDQMETQAYLPAKNTKHEVRKSNSAVQQELVDWQQSGLEKGTNTFDSVYYSYGDNCANKSSLSFAIDGSNGLESLRLDGFDGYHVGTPIPNGLNNYQDQNVYYANMNHKNEHKTDNSQAHNNDKINQEKPVHNHYLSTNDLANGVYLVENDHTQKFIQVNQVMPTNDINGSQRESTVSKSGPNYQKNFKNQRRQSSAGVTHETQMNHDLQSSNQDKNTTFSCKTNYNNNFKRSNSHTKDLRHTNSASCIIENGVAVDNREWISRSKNVSGVDDPQRLVKKENRKSFSSAKFKNEFVSSRRWSVNNFDERLNVESYDDRSFNSYKSIGHSNNNNNNNSNGYYNDDRRNWFDENDYREEEDEAQHDEDLTLQIESSLDESCSEKLGKSGKIGLKVIACGMKKDTRLPIPHANYFIDKGNFGDDAGFWSETEGHAAIGLADGATGNIMLGYDPGDFPRNLMQICSNLFISDNSLRDPKDLLMKAFDLLQEKTCYGSCTACVLTLDNAKNLLKVANIGDSGYRLIRNGRIAYKSEPQRLSADCPRQIDSYPWKAESRAMGVSYTEIMGGDCVCDTVEILKDDVIVLSSDGLYDNLEDEEIEEICNKSRSLVDAAKKMVNQSVKNYKKPDDILVIIGKIIENKPMTKHAIFSKESTQHN